MGGWERTKERARLSPRARGRSPRGMPYKGRVSFVIERIVHGARRLEDLI